MDMHVSIRGFLDSVVETVLTRAPRLFVFMLKVFELYCLFLFLFGAHVQAASLGTGANAVTRTALWLLSGLQRATASSTQYASLITLLLSQVVTLGG